MLVAIGVLVATGLVQAYGRGAALFYGRLPEVVVGVAGLVVCAAVDYRKVVDCSWWLYGGLMAALVRAASLVSLVGARVWLDPTPYILADFLCGLVYLVVAVVFGRVYGRGFTGGRAVRHWIVSGGVVVLTCSLVWIQPAGTALGSIQPAGTAVGSIMAGAVAGAVVAGLRMRVLAAGALVAVVFAAGLWTSVLADWQRQRVAGALDPDRWGYQMEMRVMVGSGGFSGRELQDGLVFDWILDEFVLTLIAREHGLVGVLFTLGLYLFVVMRSLWIARAAVRPAGAVLVVSFVAGLAFQVLWSAVVSSGLWPAGGPTLPLLTSGASTVAPLLGLGLVLSVGMTAGSETGDGRLAGADRRIAGVGRCVSVVFALVLIWYGYLQIVQHERLLRMDLERDCDVSVLC